MRTHSSATLWSSLAVRSRRHAVFFSGDTGLTTEYAAIRERLGPFDLVMLEVGAFHPSWGHIHLGPENALKALELLGGGAFLPVHWGTFSLAMHAWDQPMETLLAQAPGLTLPLLTPRLGEALEPRFAPVPTPWWRQSMPELDGKGFVLRAATAQPVPDTGHAHPVAGDLPWPLD